MARKFLNVFLSILVLLALSFPSLRRFSFIFLCMFDFFMFTFILFFSISFYFLFFVNPFLSLDVHFLSISVSLSYVFRFFVFMFIFILCIWDPTSFYALKAKNVFKTKTLLSPNEMEHMSKTFPGEWKSSRAVSSNKNFLTFARKIRHHSGYLEWNINV